MNRNLLYPCGTESSFFLTFGSIGNKTGFPKCGKGNNGDIWGSGRLSPKFLVKCAKCRAENNVGNDGGTNCSTLSFEASILFDVDDPLSSGPFVGKYVPEALTTIIKIYRNF